MCRSGNGLNLKKMAPCMARKGGLIGATLRSGYLASRYAVLEAERLLSRAVTWRHSTKRVLSEPLGCVGSGEPFLS